MSRYDGTRILTQADVAALLPLADCVTAVEDAFRRDARGDSLAPGILSMHAEGGAFHTKAAGLGGYFAVKTNANFFENPSRGMPRIQGAIVLFDATNGFPLAILDSIEITIRRTGAATAVAARHLAREDARVATIIGCGHQGRVSIEALRTQFSLERIFVYDMDRERARALAAELPGVVAVDDFATALAESDLCVTCTPSRQSILDRSHVRPGLFIAAVGADSSEKQEIAPELMASSRVVVDHLDQCATIGDLHHALEAGVMRRDDVVATLGEVIIGRKPGRTSADDVLIYDSTGTALQDVATAALVYERSVAEKRGIVIRLAA